MFFSFKQILKGLSPVRGRPGEYLAPFNFVQIKDNLTEKHPNVTITETDMISSALYPKVTEDYINFRETYGPVQLLDTRIFLEGPTVGEELEVGWRSSLLLRSLVEFSQTLFLFLLPTD